MNGSVNAKVAKGLGTSGGLVGVGVGVLLLGGASTLQPTTVVWSLGMVLLSAAGVYAVWAERLLVVWPLAVAFGAVALVTLQTVVVLTGTLLYVLAAVLLTVDRLNSNGSAASLA